MKNTFATNLSNIMKTGKVKQIDLSIKTGVIPVTMCRYISGKRVPNVYTAVKIAKALGVTVEDLISE